MRDTIKSLLETIYYRLKVTKSDFIAYANGNYYIHFSYCHEDDDSELIPFIYKVGDDTHSISLYNSDAELLKDVLKSVSELDTWYIVDSIPTKIQVNETKTGSCRYSPSDLQQLVLDTSSLLKLAKTFVAHETNFLPMNIITCSGWVYDEDGNDYILRAYIDQSKGNQYIEIGRGSVKLELNEFILWGNILHQASVINSLNKTIVNDVKEYEKLPFWKKVFLCK